MHTKRGQETITRIKVNFFDAFAHKSLANFNCMLIDSWRTSRLKEGIKPSTVNRDVTIIKAALSKARQWGLIDSHPLANLKPLKIDKTPKI